MKIVYFYQYFSTPKGSWGTRVFEFGSAWVEAGHDVTVVTALYSKSDLQATKLVETQFHNGIRVKVINVRIDNTQSFLKRMGSFVRYMLISSWFAVTLPANIVIASSGPITVGFPGLVARYLRGRKLIFEVRDLWPTGAIELGVLRNRLFIGLAYAFEKWCYSAATHIVTLSPGMSSDIHSRLGYSKQTSITNGANIEMFGTLRAGSTPFTGKKYAVYTGNIGEVNNSQWLFDAARYLTKKGRPDIIILVIGEGQLRRSLELQRDKEAMTNFVILGLMPKEDLVMYIQQSMVSLVPLKGTPVLDSSSPNKFFESLAAGIPVIQNTQGWMKDFLLENSVGYTVSPTDPEALCDLLITISGDIHSLHEMGQRAKRVASRYFDKNKLAREMLSVIENAAREK